VNEAEQRARIEAIARSWIGTPYHVHAEIKGVGVDCGRLLALVFEEAGFGKIRRTFVSPQFWMHSAKEVFLENVLEYTREIPESEAKPGDVVLYKMGLAYGHGAIIVSPGWPHAVIHAPGPKRCVICTHGRQGTLVKSIRAPRFFTRWMVGRTNGLILNRAIRRPWQTDTAAGCGAARHHVAARRADPMAVGGTAEATR
jgi:cell wall-associated NlpC family hydrolase